MARIGFIGLGNMGAPMAANLVRAGHDLRGFDVVPAARERLAASGGTEAASAEAAAEGAEIVLTMLPAGAHVRAVLLGEGGAPGLLASLPAGTLVVDSSTIDVATARAVHAEGTRRGLATLDAPVSGGVGGAEAGTLTFMVGGGDDAFARGRPVLEAMGRAIIHAGGAGAGQAAKLCNNLMLGITMVGVAEAFALAARLGLSAQSLFDIASKSSGQSWALTGYCPVPGPVPSSPANRDYQAGFAVALMAKDLGLAVEAASAAGLEAALGQDALATYRRLMEQGLAAKDFSVVAREIGAG